jgi:hypothetical protein
MASVSSHQIRQFTSPVNSAAALDANIVRGNDNILRAAYVAHDADPTIHIQSGTLANRPTTIANGSTYYATDTGDTYSRVSGVWVLSAWAHWYGSAFDTTDQTAPTPTTSFLLLEDGSFLLLESGDKFLLDTGSTSSAAVTFNTLSLARGVTLTNSSRLNVQYAGDYNIQFSAQLRNPDSSECDVWLWFAKNGTAVASSAGRITVPKKHGSTDGHSLVCWNVMLTLVANDYVELYWQTQDVTTVLETVAPFGNAPQSPSAILTINRI